MSFFRLDCKITNFSLKPGCKTIKKTAPTGSGAEYSESGISGDVSEWEIYTHMEVYVAGKGIAVLVKLEGRVVHAEEEVEALVSEA